MATLDEQIRIASDSIRRMAEVTAASSVPKLATLLHMVADNERSMADLCAASGTSAYAIERAVGMTWPRPTNAELLAALNTPFAVDSLSEQVAEFGRRIAHLARRYALGDNVDLLPASTLHWHPVTDTPPHGWHLVSIGGEVHEAWHFFDDTDTPLLIRGWRLADDATHRRMLRTGATVTAWSEMPKAPVDVESGGK